MKKFLAAGSWLLSAILVMGFSTYARPEPSSQRSVQSAAAQGLPGRPISPSFFSMTIGFRGLEWPTVPIGSLGETAGNGWFWIARSRGVFNWRGLDYAISVAQSHGARTVFYNLHTTPPWASSNPGQPCLQGRARGCNAPPADLADWDDFVTALVKRYKGQINYYEVWDEPNRPAAWSGSIEEMLRLAERAYKIIKSIDPNANVLTPGVTVGGVQPVALVRNPHMSWLESYLRAGGGRYADAVTWHGFLCKNGVFGCNNGIGCDVGIDCAGTPLLTQIHFVRSFMERNGLAGKPIIDTSGGWGRDDNLPDADQRAAYVARWYVLQAAEGVLIADWWGWNVGDWGTLWVPGTGNTRAAEAYTQTYSWLVGATMNGPCSLSGAVSSCELTRPGGYQGLIVWSSSRSSTETMPYAAPSRYKQYRDLAGRTFPLRGRVEISLKPILLETGPPPG